MSRDPDGAAPLVVAGPRGRTCVRRYVDTVWRMLTQEICFQKFIDAPVRGKV